MVSHTQIHPHTHLLLRSKETLTQKITKGHTYTPLQTHAQMNTHEITMYVASFFFVRAASDRIPRHLVVVRHATFTAHRSPDTERAFTPPLAADAPIRSFSGTVAFE